MAEAGQEVSRTIKSRVAPGTEWWSRRPFRGNVNKGSRWTGWFKAKTHRIERQRAKKEKMEP